MQRCVLDLLQPTGEISPGKRTGCVHVCGGVNSKDVSRISMEDYAMAVLDVIEKPAHVRKRFTIGY